MDKVTQALGRWLARNNIPREGVRIIIEFPDSRAAFEAECCIKRDTEPWLTHIDLKSTGITTMNGIGLALRVMESRSR